MITLCHLQESDLPHIQKYASDKRIADTTATIPHPYPENGAKIFFELNKPKIASGECLIFSVHYQNEFVGLVSLYSINPHLASAEIGYWIAVPFWRQGFAQEAVQKILLEAKNIKIKKIYGRCLKRNPASIHVLEKNGFEFQGESIGCGQHKNEAVWNYILRIPERSS